MAETTCSSDATLRPAEVARFFVGIDVGKETLDVALLARERTFAKSFSNEASGFTALTRWIARLTGGESFETHVCMEASGGYEEAAAIALVQHGCLVSVVNPRQTKSYAGVQLRRSKTDAADAALLARYCWKERPRLWSPDPPAQRELRELTRALEALKRERTRMRNRRSRATCEAVAAAYEQVLETLTAQIAVLETSIRELMRNDAALAEKRDLLVSIPGIGLTTAAIVLAELGDVSRFACARQAAAYAGLTPSLHISGTSVKRRSRLSKIGNSRLRRALYLPAISALRSNTVIQHLAHRLEERGKAKMTIVGASMRKLVHLCFGVLRNGRTFDACMHPAI
jgi:transposase